MMKKTPGKTGRQANRGPQKKAKTPAKHPTKKPVKKSAKKAEVKKSPAKPDKQPVNNAVPPKRKKTTSSSAMSAAPSARAKAFPVVALGASAGGLEALEAFFGSMPSASGMGFVVVAHLSPDHISMLPELIQKHTAMPVRQVLENTPVMSDCVYVIAPGKELAILNGSLMLMDAPGIRGARLPIDAFFRSLAEDQGGNAVGIILSGTGTDGTLGLKAIKAQAGMVMVQSEASAKYGGMPGSAIAAGVADYVFPAAELPARLVEYAEHKKHSPGASPLSRDAILPDALQKVYIILRRRTGHDFSQYKTNTIFRRIERRMHIHKIDKIGDYVRYLGENDGEADVLFSELLIGVTSFFRDPKAFDALKDEVLPGLIARMPEEKSLRVWVPGCSTGEEAYSIAMAIQECQEKLKTRVNVQIFGTDMDDNAVETARAGVYSAGIAADVSSRRLLRFFVKEDNTFRIHKNIREMLVFAPQDLIKDPPFTKLDLLCCRNLLIYLGGELQKKLVPLFHYSLKPGGALFLGSSETIGRFVDLFTPINRKWKIYARKASDSSSGGIPVFPSSARVNLPDLQRDIKAHKRTEELSAFQLVETLLQQSSMPPCVIINHSGEIVYVHGRTGLFLEHAQGRISTHLTDMARPGLVAALSDAIRRVQQDNQEVSHTGLKLENNGGFIFVNLIVRPLVEQPALRGMMMVLFEQTAAPGKSHPAKKTAVLSPARKQTREKLEFELRDMRESLQTTIEELQSSNEELKSANEELQSTNEELQSTNEEMETSKEELQSLNEESSTVNTELQSRIDELAASNDDMKNLLDSTQIATLFVDTKIRVRRFTPRAVDIIPLTALDKGRPLEHFASNLENISLPGLAQSVLDDLIMMELEVKNSKGDFYSLKIRPYRTTQNVIDGAVLTFENITQLKTIENELRRRTEEMKENGKELTRLLENGKDINIVELRRIFGKLAGG